MAKKTYLVLQTITRQSDGKDFVPGDTAELNLSASEENVLLAKRVIKPVEEPEKKEKKEEVKTDG